MRWFKRARKEPVELWNVQFDDGGQIYTYRRTATDFTREMQERYMVRGAMPHRIEVLRDGQVCRVELREE